MGGIKKSNETQTRLLSNLSPTELIDLMSKPSDRKKTSIALSESIQKKFKKAIGNAEYSTMLEALMKSFCETKNMENK